MVFVFNLIIGTGALTLPAAFSRAGWLGGSVMVLLVGFISYVTVTFVIEAMASANAILHLRNALKRRVARDVSELLGHEINSSILKYFFVSKITDK